MQLGRIPHSIRQMTTFRALIACAQGMDAIGVAELLLCNHLCSSCTCDAKVSMHGFVEISNDAAKMQFLWMLDGSPFPSSTVVELRQKSGERTNKQHITRSMAGALVRSEQAFRL